MSAKGSCIQPYWFEDELKGECDFAGELEATDSPKLCHETNSHDVEAVWWHTLKGPVTSNPTDKSDFKPLFMQ